jgi:Fe-Mn family superoxide dismutase
MKFTLPDLPYPVAALEPYIDARTMELHHGKHHAGYVAKLNDALAKVPDLQADSIEEVLRSLDRLPEAVRTTVRNNGGGHYNHSLFWQIMKPGGGGKPAGELLQRIEKSFGSFESFREQFGTAAIGVFGSGWAWLTIAPGGRLVIGITPNQDNPVMSAQVPILGLDVWEHAYYLKYQNRRPEYVAAFWNVVNWERVAQNLNEAQA